MNRDRLNQLIDIYIDKFDMINNDEERMACCWMGWKNCS